MSLPRHEEPIVAIATAPGRGAVGIVRISGRDLGAFVHALCGRALPARQATLLPFRAADGSLIDRGLAIHFPAPHSYTGEDVLELQAHGGPVVLQLLLARCLEAGAHLLPDTGRVCLPGLRLAEPGEFTERAFLNDKLDLAQAEAVADLIDASTEAAARSASLSLSGAFSHEVQALAARIVKLRMLVEATLDFPEEEIDFLEAAGARRQLGEIRAAVDAVLARARQGALLREGLRVVLAGQPNVSKSSLLNALAGAELAIVTPIPGTTRDRVSETIQIEGVPLHITDTAGLRELGSPGALLGERMHDAAALEMAEELGDAAGETIGEVERIGIGRSWDAIAQADAVLFLHDLTRLGQPLYDRAEAAIAAQLPAGARVLHVHTKTDLAPMPPAHGTATAAGVAISARTGAGLAALRAELLARAGWQASPDGVFIARSRHVQALRRAQEHLALAADHAAQRDAALDLLAEELRLAHDALGEITGRYTSDDLLGDIFSRFCIGK